jgi:excinuclease ABC subunit A
MSRVGRSSAARPPRRGRSRAGKSSESPPEAEAAGSLVGASANARTSDAPVRRARADAPLIKIRGARTHNLQNVDLDLPRNELIVITGPSGSGKSSLAFDTIFAEGQRRYVESLSVAARQFLSQLPKPDVDLIEGLSPAVAISQESRGRNPRSTVGTVTEIHDYLRLLFARVGKVYSHQSGLLMQRHSIEDMIDAVMTLDDATRFSILAPVVVDRPGDHAELLEDLRRQGFPRIAIDDEVRDLDELAALDPQQRHTIEVYVDRLKMKEGLRGRVADSIDQAVRLTGGRVKVLTLAGEVLEFSTHHADLPQGVVYPEITPSLFSFNSIEGACPDCDGLGSRTVLDPRRIVPDPARSIADGAVVPAMARGGHVLRKRIEAVAEHLGARLDAPWSELDEEVKIAILEGTGGEAIAALDEQPFEGVRPWLERRLRDLDGRSTDDAEEPGALEELSAYLRDESCRACEGQRLRLEARMVRIEGKNIYELSIMPLDELRELVGTWRFEGEEHEIAEAVLDQVRKRLAFLVEVGLGYLTLDRTTMTLSGGESQRIRLATQVGAALVGITYILDEPSIGLHQRDNHRLISTLEHLRDLGNTVIVVEHDEDTMRAADWIVDMGPGAGLHGGHVVAQGELDALLRHDRSPTGLWLSGRRRIAVPTQRRRPRGGSIVIKNARGHNLRGLTARIPVGCLTCVTGVSGSGKSTLIIDTLLPEVARAKGGGPRWGLEHGSIDGLKHIDKVIHVDQSPIGRSARSNPATYTGIFTELRQVYANLPEARVRGYQSSRFSFNVKGGRCEACLGDGVKRIEMHFLPDLFVTCRTCGGRRYNRETLAVRMRGKSIADVLEMPVAEAYEFFVTHKNVRNKLEVLRDVGLGYVQLGQSASTLSGGEAQRIKLARELSKKATGSTLFILDEPTTGLHFGDVEQLLGVLQRLVDEGNTVVVIEHDLDVIKCADHVIDVGPEGGIGGGTLVASGTPEQVARAEGSHTGRFLRTVLETT